MRRFPKYSRAQIPPSHDYEKRLWLAKSVTLSIIQSDHILFVKV